MARVLRPAPPAANKKVDTPHGRNTSVFRMNAHPEAERFLRQMLLHRYAQLIQKIESIYELSESQKQLLAERILTLDWVDSALGDGTN
jgi:hypothetical protein